VSVELHQGDAVAWLRSLPSESIDLVITDPAYESLEKHRARGTTTRLSHSKASSNDWFSIFPNARFGELFAELYRVLRRDRHLYVFCDAETMFVAKPVAEAAGFKFWKPIVWDKVSIGMGYHYRARYEFVLFFEKGKRALADLSIADVITAKRIRGGFPTEKPVEVSEVLVRQSSEPGELVADPFMGSGSVGVAATRLGRAFTGNDLCADAVEITRRRIDETRAS
jgi:site-specific DNA-methyltransferase (adenine-specific)